MPTAFLVAQRVSSYLPPAKYQYLGSVVELRLSITISNEVLRTLYVHASKRPFVAMSSTYMSISVNVASDERQT